MLQDCAPAGVAGVRPHRAPIAILSYHQTATPPARGTPYRSLVLPPAQFERQLRALRLLGWRGLSLRDLEPYLAGRLTGRVFGITLDDGYRNNFDHALPVLRELGFTATAFAVSSQLGGSNVWDHANGVPPAPLMDVAHLRTWSAAGMEVGGHTRHHVNLCACTDAKARDEITGCRQELEDVLGAEVRSFSYPHGLHAAQHVEMVREAGFTRAVTVVSARAGWNDEPLRLPRLSVHATEPLAMLVARVTTPLEDWRIARRLRRAAAAMPATSMPAAAPAATAAPAASALAEQRLTEGLAPQAAAISGVAQSMS